MFSFKHCLANRMEMSMVRRTNNNCVNLITQFIKHDPVVFEFTCLIEFRKRFPAFDLSTSHMATMFWLDTPPTLAAPRPLRCRRYLAFHSRTGHSHLQCWCLANSHQRQRLLISKNHVVFCFDISLEFSWRVLNVTLQKINPLTVS